jgi:Rrf2 family protein
MLSYTCKTAVKAVIYLASKFETGERCGIVEIAEYLEASEHTVGKMLQTLVKQDVIKSLKGPSGGFYITKIQVRQPIINIVNAIDGDQVFKECGLGLSKCSSTHPCPIHDDYKVGRDSIEALFRNKKIIDLYEPVNKGLTYLFG